MDEKKFKSLSQDQQNTVIKIAKEAERQGVNPEFAIAIAEAETGGKFSHYGKNGVLESPAGARGLMQMMPDTVNLYNKKFNLPLSSSIVQSFSKLNRNNSEKIVDNVPPFFNFVEPNIIHLANLLCKFQLQMNSVAHKQDQEINLILKLLLKCNSKNHSTKEQ